MRETKRDKLHALRLRGRWPTGKSKPALSVSDGAAVGAPNVTHRSFLNTSAVAGRSIGLVIIAPPLADLAKSHAGIKGDRRHVRALDFEKQRPHMRRGKTRQAVGQQSAADSRGYGKRYARRSSDISASSAATRDSANPLQLAAVRIDGGSADRRLARQQASRIRRATRDARKRPRESPHIARPCRCAKCAGPGPSAFGTETASNGADSGTCVRNARRRPPAGRPAL